jgi:hypothetical protein
MPDGSKQPFITAQSGSGSGTTDYNQLIGKPIQNLTGSPVVLSTLPTGVYKITGSWSLLEGSATTTATADDVFLVENTSTDYKVVVLQAEAITSITCPVGGTEGDIVTDSVAMASTLWGSF